MKKLVQGASAVFIAMFLALTGVGAASAASDFPVPPAPSLESPIVDTSGKLSADQIKQLASTIKNEKVAGKRQIAVLVVDSLNGAVLEDASIKVAREWGVGEKTNSNGVLLMVAVKDRKLRIEVGDGLEGALPDITTKRITDKYITPAFKKGDYFTGIRDGVVQIDAAVAGEKFESGDSASNVPGWVVLVVILGIILVMALPLVIGYFIFRRKHKNRRSLHGGSSDGGDDGLLLWAFLSSLGSGSSGGGGSSSRSSGSGWSSGGGSDFGGGGFSGGGSSSDW